MMLRSLSRAAAEDLMDGIDLGDHDCGGFSDLPRLELPPDPPRRPRRQPETGRPYGPRPPACPGLLTLKDLDELDRRFQAGGEVTDKVVRGILRDLRSPPLS
jgi:hypothetical protein